MQSRRIAATRARFGNPILAFQRFPRVPITGGVDHVPDHVALHDRALGGGVLPGRADEPAGQGRHLDSLRPLERHRHARHAAAARVQQHRRRAEPVRLSALPRPIGAPGAAVGHACCSATRFNMSIGFDINRFIRQLNPTQTFFITTQFFYKHVFDAPGRPRAAGAVPQPPRRSAHRRSSAIPNDPENALAARRRLRPEGQESTAKRGATGHAGLSAAAALLPARARPLPADAAHHHVVLGRADRALPRHVLRLGGRRASSSPASRWCATRSASPWTTPRSPRSPRSSSARCATGTTSASRSSTCSDSARGSAPRARGRSAGCHSPVARSTSTTRVGAC